MDATPTTDPSAGTQRVLDDVLAVLVLYGQPLAESATFQSLEADLRQRGDQLDLLVYDNSPVPHLPPASPAWRLDYISDPTNPGVSQAYLEGGRLAAQRAKRWLFFLDQDTRFPPGALAAYVDAVHRYPDIGLFAPLLRAHGSTISPCRYRLKRGVAPRNLHPGLRRLAGHSVLNSGMWISLDEYLATGGHDPRIALDFADHEFIDRYKRRHEHFVALSVECDHDLSAGSVQPIAHRLTRFRSYCSGAHYAIRGPGDALLTAGVVGARACLLALRHRHPGFLRVAADALLGINRAR
jgi:rhamnosyltransferase